MSLKDVLGVVCGLALTSSVSAQAPLPKPTQPQTGQAQVQRANQYPPALYRMNDVSKSLNLTPEQVTSLNKVTEQTQAKYRDDYAKLATLNDAERFARTQELNRQYANDWNKSARAIFNDTQRSRYQQYNYQYGGFNSFYDPEVQKSLNLTERQIKDLREQAAWSDQQLRDINRLGATDPDKGAQMYREYWQQRGQRFNTFLTPEQQKAWGRMTGEQYQFQPGFAPPR